MLARVCVFVVFKQFACTKLLLEKLHGEFGDFFFSIKHVVRTM